MKKNKSGISHIAIILFAIFILSVIGCTQTAPSIKPTSATPIIGGTETVDNPVVNPKPQITTVNINIRNFVFDPETVTIKVGTQVTWTQDDSARHSVSSDSGLFESGLLSQGETFSYTFDKIGTYKYHCSSHTRMLGTIIVQ